MVSHPPQSLYQNLDVLFPRWGRNSPTQTSHSCICSQMGTTEEADWSLASGASSQPLEGAAQEAVITHS